MVISQYTGAARAKATRGRFALPKLRETDALQRRFRTQCFLFAKDFGVGVRRFSAAFRKQLLPRNHVVGVSEDAIASAARLLRA
jgi:hypothetical protein